jgi:membrane protein implicated in regulation of membrane protease activity
VSVFVVVGLIGVVIVVGSLLFGDFLDGLFDAVDLGSGLVSAPVIGGFLAAFGFGGALAAGALGPGPAAVVGVAAGLVFGGVAGVLTRALMRMRTDPTPRSDDLVGRTGVVLTPVSAARYGQVRVAAHGQQLQLAARADEALPSGTRIVVVEVSSPTAVVVTPLNLPTLP